MDMGRRRNRKQRALWRHQRRSSTTKKDLQSGDTTSDGTQAADPTADSVGTHESQEESFFSENGTSMGALFDSSSADSLMLDGSETSGAEANIRGNVEVGLVPSMERDLSCVNMEEALSSSRADSNESMREDEYNKPDTENPLAISDGEERKILPDSTNHSESVFVVESLPIAPVCPTEENNASSFPSSEVVPPNQKDIESHICLGNQDLSEDHENFLLDNTASCSTEDHNPMTQKIYFNPDEHEVNIKAVNEECIVKEGAENVAAGETEYQYFGNSSVDMMTQFSQRSEKENASHGEAESPENNSRKPSSDSLKGGKTHLENGAAENSSAPNEDCFAVQSFQTFDADVVFQNGEITKLESAHSKPVAPQTKPSDTEDLERMPPETIRMDQSESQIHDDLTKNETVLEQNGVTDTPNEDQFLQKDSVSQENLTFAENESKEATRESGDHWSVLLPTDQHLKKESQEQSHENIKHQSPEEMIRDEGKEIPPNNSQKESFSSKDAQKDLLPEDDSVDKFSKNAQFSEELRDNQAPSDQNEILSANEDQPQNKINLGNQIVVEDKPEEQVPETSSCDEPAEEPPAKYDSTGGDIKDSGESTFSEDSTSNQAFLHQSETLDSNKSNEEQPPREIYCGATENQAVAKDESVEKIAGSTGNGAMSVQSVCDTSQGKPKVQLNELQSNEQGLEQADNSTDSTKNELLNSNNAAAAPLAPTPITPHQLIKLKLVYHSWRVHTKSALMNLQELQRLVTSFELSISGCKHYCVKRSLRNKLRKEGASWFGRVTSGVSAIVCDYSLAAVSLVHQLVVVVVRVKLSFIMRAARSAQKQLYAQSPAPIVEGKTFKDCMEQITKTTVCGVVKSVLGKINATQQGKIKKTTGDSSTAGTSSFIHRLCDAIAGHLWCIENSDEVVKTLQDFLADNQPIVEAYLATSKALYGSFDLFKTCVWDVLTRKGPDLQAKMTDMMLIMQDYGYQYALHQKGEGGNFQSSVIAQMEGIRAAIQTEDAEITKMLGQMGIIRG